MRNPLAPHFSLKRVSRIGGAVALAGAVAAPIALAGAVKDSKYEGSIKSYKSVPINFYVGSSDKQVSKFNVEALHKSKSCLDPGGTASKRTSDPTVSISSDKFKAVVDYEFTNGSKAKWTVTISGTFGKAPLASGTASFKYADSACSGSASWKAESELGY